ncbi:YceI family protein [Albibacterium indicum]|uniref:YceI family protein n=1 Tax=Albibacterium indicum TaxID=2292082 RepID=UPI000E4FA2DB|nr:YceI family protein [Pedobacter indicus]
MNTVDTTTKWVLDPTHSELIFKIKHLMITNVKGEFQKFNITVDSKGNDFSDAKVSATIETDSIFTNNADRDAHLRSADFFDAEKFPQITFNSMELNKLDDENYQLKGILDMHGVEKEVILDVEFGGFVKDPYGNHKAGFSVSGKLNRKDWGLNWNAALEAGGVMVSEEVRLNAEVQFVKEA